MACQKCKERRDAMVRKALEMAEWSRRRAKEREKAKSNG
jgi:hypothetical protein